MTKLAKAFPDIAILSGAGSVAVGAWMIYPPAGFIVGGLAAIIIGVLAARIA